MIISDAQLHTLGDFLVGTILIKYLVVGWIARIIVKVFKFALTRSEIEAITWIHYSEAAMHRGHEARTPYECNDALCKRMKRKRPLAK